jgi:chromosome segregation ATPase
VKEITRRIIRISVMTLTIFYLLFTTYSILLTGDAFAWQWPWQKKSPQSTVCSPQQEETILKDEKRKLQRMDYEGLIQRNLELRKEVLAKEEENKALLQERNTLIMHIKELQKEKENLAKAVKDIQTAPQTFKEWQAKLDTVNKRLDMMTKDRDRLQKQLDKAKERLASLDNTIFEEVEKQVERIRLERTELFKTLQKDKVRLQDEVRRLKRMLEKKEKETKRLNERLKKK